MLADAAGLTRFGFDHRVGAQVARGRDAAGVDIQVGSTGRWGLYLQTGDRRTDLEGQTVGEFAMGERLAADLAGRFGRLILT